MLMNKQAIVLKAVGVVVVAVIAGASPAWSQAASEGERAYRVCGACHSVKAGEKRMGPTMFGIVGRKSAADAGFKYSPAMTKSKITWTKARLDAFLKAPQKSVPGNRMAFGGIADDAKRAALVNYLATLQ